MRNRTTERTQRAMTAGDLAVTLAALLCAIGFAALIVVLVRVLDTLKALRREVESLRSETRPLLAELRDHHRRGACGDGHRPRPTSSASTGCSARPRRSATPSTAAAGSPGRAFSAPMIKAAGLATGTSRAVRRLRAQGAPRPSSSTYAPNNAGGGHDEASHVVRGRRRRRCGRRRLRQEEGQAARPPTWRRSTSPRRPPARCATRAGTSSVRSAKGVPRCTPARTSCKARRDARSRPSTTGSSRAISCTSTVGRSTRRG